MLDLILQRADLRDGSTFSADEVAQWPPGVLDRLLIAGLVREITPTNAVTCDQCEDACWIEPMVRDNPRTGKPIGMYFCRTHEDIGRFEVSLDRLKRWEVHWAGLAASVAKSLSVAGSAEEIVPDRLCCLGHIAYADKSLEVFLGRGMAWSDAASVFGCVPRLQSATPTVVLVPAVPPATTRWCRSAMPLTEIARLDDAGLHVDMEEFRRRLTGAAAGAGRTSSRKAKALAKKTVLVAAILKHHGFSTDNVVYESASQKQLAKLSKLSQPNVSRTMEELFGPRPMSRYRRLCRPGALEGFLAKLDDGTLVPEVPTFRSFQPTEKEDSLAKND